MGNTLVWADSDFLMASNLTEFSAMTQDLTDADHFRRKASNLQLLRAGGGIETLAEPPSVTSQSSLSFRAVDQLEVLGRHDHLPVAWVS